MLKAFVKELSAAAARWDPNFTADYSEVGFPNSGSSWREDKILNLFIHFMTNKPNKYSSVKEYQLNLKLTLQKLHKSEAPLPKDLQLAAFLYGVEETYGQWAFAKRSTIQSKAKKENLPTFDDFTAKLLNKSCITIAIEAKALATSKANNGRRNGNKPCTRCTFCKKERHKEDNCWKKHPKKRPARFKHQDSTGQTSISQDVTDDKGILKGKRKEGKYFGAAVFF